MGYNSWYQHNSGVSEGLIKSVADQMATNGMRAVGYQYVNLDDGWAGSRDTNGNIIPDPDKFPGGMKALADYVHAEGFKFGLYTTGSTNTCAFAQGSIAHEEQDALTFASWGVDFVKFEACRLAWYELIPDVQVYCARMQQALAHAGRPMVFSLSIALSEYWLPNYCNLPRGTGDFDGSWDAVLRHIDLDAASPFVPGPGVWNDADVLPVYIEAGPDQNMAVFSMWCMLVSPLLAQTVDNSLTNIQCNAEAIAVDQDPAWVPGKCVLTNGDLQVWSKPLGASNSTTRAVLLFNRGTNTGCITANWSDVGQPVGPTTVRDLWAHGYVGILSNSFTAAIPPHGCRFLKLSQGAAIPLPPYGTNYLSDLSMLVDQFPATSPVRLDLSATGQPLSLDGVGYAKGLGVSGASRARYYLGGAASRFISDIGLDDANTSPGASLVFQVYADGVKLYDSGVINVDAPTRSISLDLTGCGTLTLITKTSGTVTNTYGDWAGARVVLPTAPGGLTISAAARQITLNWDPVAGATAYLVERSTNSGGPYSLIATTTNTTYIDGTVTPGIPYFYMVSSVIAGGGNQTTNSVQVSAILPALWINSMAGAPQAWNLNINWTNAASFPNQAGLPAVLNSSLSSNQIANLNQPITIGALAVGDARAASRYTIAGNGGTLTFDNNGLSATLTQLASSAGDTLSAPVSIPGSLTVENDSLNPLTIQGSISGPGSLTLTGPGAVVLAGSNNFPNPITVARGILRIGGPLALSNAPAGSVVANGSSLDLNGFSIGATPVTVAGGGPDSQGGIVSTASGPAGNALQFVTLTDNTTFGGVGDWDIRGAHGTTPSGSLNSGGEPFSLTKTNANKISLAAVHVDPALGNINVQQGALSFEGPTSSMGDPAATLTVSQGATLAFSQTTTPWSKNFVLNGDGVTTTVSNILGSNTIAGPITLAGMPIFAVNSGTLNVAGSVTGAAGLSKTLAGAMLLSGPDTFVGPLSVGAGAVILAGSGSISNCTSVTVASGALLDASGVAGGNLSFAAGQTLSGGGSLNGNVTIGSGALLAPATGFGMLTFSNDLRIVNGTVLLAVSEFPAINEQLKVYGKLTYGGTLVVSNVASTPLVPGDSFKLFTASSFAGVFTNIVPQVPGPGISWDTSTLDLDGTLRIGQMRPHINTFAAHAGSVMARGSGGTPVGFYRILTSANPWLPLAKWTPLATNVFDGAGSFAFTNLINTNLARQFFAMQLLPVPVVHTVASDKFSLSTSGSGGTPFGTYYILASADPRVPLTQWARVATNQFDGLGAFSFTNLINTNQRAMYFRMATPFP